MAVDLVRGSVLAPLGYVAVGIALVAGVLLGGPRRRGSRPTVRAAWMAAAAGLLLGAVLVLLDATPADSGVVPLVANRFATAVIMALCLVVRRAQRAPRIAAVPVTAAGLAATAAGVVDAVANGFTLFALRTGELTVVAAVISLSPAGTAVLAITVLRERVAPLTLLGIALGVTSAALFALG
jgi:drug/metabolite transporter (DMT)-like permease